jgi:hypothetical protein
MASKSLDEFVEKEQNTQTRWVDTLPTEVVAQIMGSQAGAAQINRWLIGEGFPESTVRRVEPLIHERRLSRG